MDSTLRIASVTGVDVELRIAGPGARSYAFILDWHVRFFLAAAWLLVGTALATRGFAAPAAPDAGFLYLVPLPSAAIYLLYHPVLEIAMHGQTPGKRRAGVRLVAAADGGAPGTGALVIRNVFRLVDSLPMLYAVGLVTTMLTRQAQRIGDLAAGTVLVYDERGAAHLLDRLDTAAVERLGLANAELVRELLDRWPQLEPSARSALAARLLARLGVEPPPGENALHAKLEELLA